MEILIEAIFVVIFVVIVFAMIPEKEPLVRALFRAWRLRNAANSKACSAFGLFLGLATSQE